MYKAITCAMFTYSPHSQCCLNTSETMLYRANYLCNVDPWLTDNVYEENNLYNSVITILEQHFIHCLVNIVIVRANTPKKTVLYIQSILAQKAHTCSHRKAGCAVVSNL